MSHRSSRRAVGVLAVVVWLLNLVRWARHTRPEPLPAPPAGSTTVVAADGTRLHAQVGGRSDGPVTIVFVHGFLARTISFDMQWNYFTDKARLVRYDHRNHGRSGRSAKQIGVHTLAADLASVIEQLAPSGPVVVVGHSMGGMTALALAAAQPRMFRERVAGVCLLATGAGHCIDGHPVENLVRRASRRHLLAPHLLAFRALAPLLEQLRPRRTHTMRWVTRELMFGSADVDPATLAMTHELLEEPALSTFGSLQGALVRHDVLSVLKELRAKPVSIVTGSDDRLTRPEHSIRMAQDIGKSAELVIIDGAGHVLNQTRPIEVNAAIDRLLARAGASRAASAGAPALAPPA